MKQELWLGNEELVPLYEETLIQAGYHTFKLPRTNNKGDGECIHTYSLTFIVPGFCAPTYLDHTPDTLNGKLWGQNV